MDPSEVGGGLVKALVCGDPALRLDSVAEPEPRPDQALVEVRAIAVNRGELALMGQLPPGSRLGWDVAGTVLRAAADGSGPAAGTRVTALAERDGWAERIALTPSRLAAVPADLDWPAAAALPVAGLTALYVLEYAGPLLGRSVLVTGAGGGVGRMLVQLAAAAGAEVIAQVGSPGRAEGLRALGAHTVETYEEGATDGAVDVLVDSVGGQVLTGAFGRVRPGGTVVCYGNTVREELRLPLDWGHARPGLRIGYLHLFDEVTRRDVGRDLASLVRLVARGLLTPEVAAVGSWNDPQPALDALRRRQANGKVVLTL
ncbi:zinc-binding dehydrogenase [Streptomyces sp. NPDC051597]|uniref:zinc-binding dehydrogenase n=1 Tax=Streptomyces sp. NPDC051597 TaxID=3155049 RepID=UPI003433D383